MLMSKKRATSQMVDEDDPQFARFWDAYPKRVAKKEARRAWAKVNPSGELVERMLAALAWQSQQPNWIKDSGAYVPYPASWLNAERWEDEQPMRAQKVMSDAAATVFATLGVKP